MCVRFFEIMRSNACKSIFACDSPAQVDSRLTLAFIVSDSFGRQYIDGLPAGVQIDVALVAGSDMVEKTLTNKTVSMVWGRRKIPQFW